MIIISTQGRIQEFSMGEGHKHFQEEKGSTWVPTHSQAPWRYKNKRGNPPLNLPLSTYNPNLPASWVGKVRKKLSPEGGRKGGWREKKRVQRARRARGWNPGPAAC